MIAVTGVRSTIVQAFYKLLPEGEEVRSFSAADEEIPIADRYLFAAGLLVGKHTMDKTPEEITETYRVNAIDPIRTITAILHKVPRARICVIGSESALEGSYDGDYAAAKGALHAFVETKVLGTRYQQLVCISPTIIEPSGMTDRRANKLALEARARENPKGRHLTPDEVAVMVHHLLYVDSGYTTGVVIRMNGGPR